MQGSTQQICNTSQGSSWCMCAGADWFFLFGWEFLLGMSCFVCEKDIICVSAHGIYIRLYFWSAHACLCTCNRAMQICYHVTAMLEVVRYSLKECDLHMSFVQYSESCTLDFRVMHCIWSISTVAFDSRACVVVSTWSQLPCAGWAKHRLDAKTKKPAKPSESREGGMYGLPEAKNMYVDGARMWMCARNPSVQSDR